MIQTIDAAVFARMITHAACAVNSQKQGINDLNVFPVPDGDTGTNMSLTMDAAAQEMRQNRYTTIAQATQSVAASLLRGARGNSGVILSLLFRGFAKAMKDKQTMDGADFAIALDFGVEAAYKAVMKPAEGTILTVCAQAATAAASHAREDLSFEGTLNAAIAQGQLALAETINQNPVLKKAGVVDAGGMGFLVILQGMLDELHGMPLPKPADAARAQFNAFSAQEITFGYCTEFICARETQKDPALLKSFLNNLGDSLVVVDGDDIIKVHVHTNDPGLALQEALSYGALLKVKIENMREQHTQILTQSPTLAQEAEKAAPQKKFGYVAVCAGEGFEAIFRDLGVDGIVGGGQTMNPCTEDILREIDATPAEIVYVLPNNKNIIMAAQQCIALSEQKQVIVLHTKTIPQGISAMLATDPALSQEENTAAMSAGFSHVHTSEVTYAARDSDFDGFAIAQGDYLALEEGQLLCTHKDLETVLAQLAKTAAHQQADLISIFFGIEVTQEQAVQAQEIFMEHCPNAEVSLLQGGQPVYYFTISAETI